MAIEQQTSRYLPIWLELKREKRCKITAPPQFHKRIIHAVKKRRDKDTGFLFSLAEQHLIHVIRYKIEGTVVTFTLHTYSTLRGL